MYVCVDRHYYFDSLETKLWVSTNVMIKPTEQQQKIIQTIANSHPPKCIRVYGGPGCAKSSTLAMATNNLRNRHRVLCMVFNREARDSMREKMGHAIKSGRAACHTYAGISYNMGCFRRYKKDFRISYSYRNCAGDDGDEHDDYDDYDDGDTLDDHDIHGNLATARVVPVTEMSEEEKAHIEFKQWLCTDQDVDKLTFPLANLLWSNIRDGILPINEKATFKLLLLDADLRYRAFRDFDTIIWDEAQDLCALKWALSRRLRTEGKHVQVFAGDPYQCINKWVGADFDAFVSMELDEDHTVSNSFRLRGSVCNATNACSRWMHSMCPSLPSSLMNLKSNIGTVRNKASRHHGYLHTATNNHPANLRMTADLSMTDVIRHLQTYRIPEGSTGYLFFRTNMQIFTFLLDNFSMIMRMKQRHPLLVVRCDPKKYATLKTSVEKHLLYLRNYHQPPAHRQRLEDGYKCKSRIASHAHPESTLGKLLLLYPTEDAEVMCQRILDIARLHEVSVDARRTHTSRSARNQLLAINDPLQRTLFDVPPPSWDRDIDLLCATVHTQKGKERTFAALMGDFAALHQYTDSDMRVLFVGISRCQHPNGLLVPARLARPLNGIITVREVLMRLAFAQAEYGNGSVGVLIQTIPKIEEFIGYESCSWVYPVCRVRIR